MNKTQKPVESQALLTLGALGVVFGDIGTSPLYALSQCFKALHQPVIDSAAVLGILSLIFWSLILVVCGKYLTFITRANHEGEGGTLAMLALIQTKVPAKPTSSPSGLILLVLFGSALLFGDGVITPSISVLSAVEGLKVASPGAQPLVVPLAITVLVGLFALQRRGTGRVGTFFGPIMALWFLSIGILGLVEIAQAPRILQALNPARGVMFLAQHGWLGIVVLGAVVLCFTGAEALFADLSHFGRRPIMLGWYGLVLPALVLNYFGEGAFVLMHPGQAQSSFFSLVPHALLWPMVALATAATVIASQALISGTFTLTQQAIHMGYFPRFRILHTSAKAEGQVYIAAVNGLLMMACVLVVLGFRSSDRLGSAYGLAVIGTMMVTSVTYFFVLRRVWKWPLAGSLLLAGFFVTIEVFFLIGNLSKIISGAWLPLLIAAVVFCVFYIWTACTARYREALKSWAMPLDEFRRMAKIWPDRTSGTGVFLTMHPDFVPLVGRNCWLREHVRPEQILLVTLRQEKVPFATAAMKEQVEQLDPGFFRITASFGFMEQPDVHQVLQSLPKNKVKIDWDNLVCYLPEACVVQKGSWVRQRIQQTYEVLGRLSLPASQYFCVPPREIIHVGVRLEL